MKKSRITRLEQILKEVSTETDIPVPLIKSKCRNIELVQARLIYSQRAKVDESKFTFKEIGKCINRNYSTVIHSLNKKTVELDTNMFKVVNYAVRLAGHDWKQLVLKAAEFDVKEFNDEFVERILIRAKKVHSNKFVPKIKLEEIEQRVYDRRPKPDLEAVGLNQVLSSSL